MPTFDAGRRALPGEGELYYLHAPARPRPVAHPVEFLPVAEFLADEGACRALWELLSGQFHTRSKFLAVWPCVRFVAAHRRGGELAGALLVSTPLNWQIDYVVVRPEWRGRGVAAALVNETVNQALARRVRRAVGRPRRRRAAPARGGGRRRGGGGGGRPAGPPGRGPREGGGPRRRRACLARGGRRPPHVRHRRLRRSPGGPGGPPGRP